MSFYRGPKVVTNGLVLALDAADRNSYPGSGTSWSDLSGNNNTGSLLNGVAFNTSNSGILSLDGINDYISIQNSTSLQVGETFTVNSWVLATGLGNRYGIFSTRFDNTAGCWQLEMGTASGGTGRLAVTGVGTWIWESADSVVSTNNWYNICYVKPNNATQGGTIYLNGAQITPTVTSAYTILNNTSIKVIGSGTAGGQLLPGNISQLNLYSRALSATEVTQNFNALRGRFGI